MTQLTCQSCQSTYPLTAPVWKCDCGGLLDLYFTPVFDRVKIESRPPTMWRYREAIPLDSAAPIVSFDEGFTPLTAVDIGGRSVWVKQDHLFPTGSYKDRGAAVLISQAQVLGLTTVVEDSSGNAGCAIAAYCAKAEIDCHIYVPANTSPGKLAQIQLYGARLNKIPGSREDTANAVWQAAQTNYYASHSWNPFFFQGTKTFAFEVCEQLGWTAPDTIILPVGNGTLLLGVALGFTELLVAGIIAKMPKIIAVQAEHCAPLYYAAQERLSTLPTIEPKETLAEGIAITTPVRGRQIIEAVQASGGHFTTVSEAEIKQALIAMSQQGYYIEPTSAATIAGIYNYVVSSAPDETIVSVFTGHGLKATEKLLKVAG